MPISFQNIVKSIDRLPTHLTRHIYIRINIHNT